jgi:two-component system, cell cycle response regulator DivK
MKLRLVGRAWGTAGGGDVPDAPSGFVSSTTARDYGLTFAAASASTLFPPARGGSEVDKTVLIVEDQYDNRAIYRDMLQHAGYVVLEAHNGAEAIDVAREMRPDLILMDLSMPVLDGWGAMELLQADPETADIPVVVLSAHVVLDGDYGRAKNAGFSGYLTKPLEPRAVLKEIRSRLEPGAKDSAGEMD